MTLNEQIDSYQKIEIKSKIDQLLMDLNNHVFLVSEDIQKVKRGTAIHADTKFNKKRLKQLEANA